MRPMSEILSDALASFDGGKRWIRVTLFPTLYRINSTDSELFCQELQKADTFCAFGAVFKSMIAHKELDHNPFAVGDAYKDPRVSEVQRLLVGTGSVAAQNDRAGSFNVVEEMFCNGIKRALAEEETDDETDV